MLIEVFAKCLQTFESFHDLTKTILYTLEKLFKVDDQSFSPCRAFFCRDGHIILESLLKDSRHASMAANLLEYDTEGNDQM